MDDIGNGIGIAGARAAARRLVDPAGRCTWRHGGWPPGPGKRSYLLRRVRLRTLADVAREVRLIAKSATPALPLPPVTTAAAAAA